MYPRSQPECNHIQQSTAMPARTKQDAVDLELANITRVLVSIGSSRSHTVSVAPKTVSKYPQLRPWACVLRVDLSGALQAPQIFLRSLGCLCRMLPSSDPQKNFNIAIAEQPIV